MGYLTAKSTPLGWTQSLGQDSLRAVRGIGQLQAIDIGNEIAYLRHLKGGRFAAQGIPCAGREPNIYSNIENLVLRARSEKIGFAVI